MDKKLEEIENERMNKVLNMILKLNTNEFITNLEQLRKSTGLQNSNIPDIRELCNNKIVELKHQFNDVDLPMFIRYYEKDNNIASSIIGMSIVDNMMKYLNEAFTLFPENTQKIEQEKSLKPVGKLTAFFNMIRGFFWKKNDVLTDTKKEEVQQYEKICQKVYGYNLKENLADSLLGFMKEISLPYSREKTLEELVIPDIVKLGVADIIPDLMGKEN